MKRRPLAAAILTIVTVIAAGCTRTEDDNPYAALDEGLTAAAYEAAVAIAGGEQIGGTVELLGVLGGAELDQFMATFEPFERATGITIEYEGTRDILSVLQTRVEGGNPPDVVSNPSVGQMHGLIADGKLLPLGDILDPTALAENYDAGLLDLASHNGELYGLFNIATVKGLVYYDPTRYDGPTDPGSWAQLHDWAAGLAGQGSTPWCIGIENGAATGWMATDWIEQFFLTENGTDAWDRWWRGELSWTSPEVRRAFELFGAIATDPSQVNGGPTAVVSTDFFQAALPLYTDPPRCSLTLQADWLATTLPTQNPDVRYGQNLRHFPFPPVNPDNAGLIEIGGELLGAFRDTPQVRALLKYAATPERNALVAATGLWISPNRAVPVDVYPSDSGRDVAAILAAANAVRFDASDLLPGDVLQAYWAAVLEYIVDPSTLDAGLAAIEAVRLSRT